MKIGYRATLAVIGAAFALNLYWRFAVRRHTLPCPSWLSWLLENPFMNSVAGAQTVLDRLALRPGMKILDVGCGPGRLTVPLAQRTGSTGLVVALDIQPAMLRRVQDKLDAAGLTNVQLVRAGVGEGKLPHDTFNRALLVTVLGEIPDRKAALAEIYQALRPGGILSVTEVLPDPHYQTPGSIRQFASEVGFEEQDYFGGFPAFTINLRKPGSSTPSRI